MIVVAPDAPTRLSQYLRAHDMLFQAVSDQKLLQLLGQEVNWLKLGRMPALIAIGREGRVVYEHHGRSMSDLPDFQIVLSALQNP